jgi:hypothetical protein
MGSVTELKESISEIREIDLKYQTFVNQVEVLASKYQFDEIIEFLEKNTEET